MTTPEELSRWDQAHYWHAFTQMAEYDPLVIERADGVWLYDLAGNRYLDGGSSMWCNLLGHAHPQVNQAICEQVGKVSHITSLGMSSPPPILLSKKLAELAPGDLNHVFMGSDGASAVEAALKMAFQYWRQCENPQPQKTSFIALGEAYHGDTIGSTSVGGIDRFTAIFRPLLFHVHRLPIPDAAALTSEQTVQHYLQQLEEVLEENHEQIAAMVLEPRIQAAAGMIFHPPGYLRGVRELTRKYNVLLIADEIVTGCCRTGRMFACEHEDVVPDLLCLGKSLTAGYLPLSATIGTEEVYSAFLGDYASARTFCHGHTYAGNCVGAAAALATLELLKTSEVQQNLRERITQLQAILEDLEDNKHVAATRQLGMIAAVEVGPQEDLNDRYPPKLRIGHRIGQEALQRGLWLRPQGDTVVIVPPISITEEELSTMGEILRKSIEATVRSLAAAKR